MNKQKYYNEKDNLFLNHSSKILHEKLKKKVREKDIKKFLQTQRYYTLYKQPTARKNERNPYRVYGLDQLWELDLVTIPSLSKYNSGVSFLLVCVDVFSRYAFVRPLKSKRPFEVVKSLVNIFKSTNRKPWKIQTDSGTEFIGKDVQNFLKNENIEFRVVKSTLPAKCAIVERFNRTLKQRIMRYLNWKKVTDQPNENQYIYGLQNIVDDYNATRHSTLKIAPENVTNANSVQIYERIRSRWKNIESKYPKLHKNDFVRIKRKRSLFEKESMKPVWSDEIFKITRIIPRHPYPVYELSDIKGRILDGKVYEREIQKIGLPHDTPIEIVKKPNVFDKTIRVKTLDGKTRLFDYNNEKKLYKENNYSDFISLLK